MDSLDLRIPSPVVELRAELLSQRQVRLLVKRDDLIHPEVTGNKWRKLKYNLEQARHEGHHTLLTFGGAYSNHIRATAAAGHYFGFDTIGVIRGEEHLPLNDTLAYARARGMRLSYLNRAAYREKSSPEAVHRLHEEFGAFYLLPEGGSNALAVRGCAELVDEIDISFDVICCPCGTGGTLAGIASALPREQEAIGFSVLKGGDFLRRDVAALQKVALGEVTENWSIELDYHFGGFAKTNDVLHSFIAEFQQQHDLLLEWVYVAKMMYGVFDLVDRGRFAPGTVIVVVITGG